MTNYYSTNQKFVTTVNCPKCNGIAHYECVMEVDLVLICLCGYYKVIYTEVGHITVSTVSKADMKDLPRPNSNIGMCMTVMLNNYPTLLTSEQVYIVLKKNMCRSSVSTNLMILQGRGLIDKIKSNKGKAGGSIWKISSYGEKMYCIT